jgi:predicted kinase
MIKDWIKNHCKFAQQEKVMIILRGISGAGKSTKAKELGQGGVVLSTDDFWMENGEYKFDVSRLGIAHKWNQNRALKALQEGISPIVIDNTSTTAWEMNFYAKAAVQYGYQVRIEEPDSPQWKGRMHPNMTEQEKNDLAQELAKRNSHGVTPEIAKRMIDRWQHNLDFKQILEAEPK